MDCLENIIGLSRKDCECLETDRPADYDESQSGIFLDEIHGLDLKGLDDTKDCGENSIWYMMSIARQNAIKHFKTDLLSSLKNKYKDRFQKFSGVIGKSKFTSTIPTPNTFMGIKIECVNIKGACITIKGINTFFDQTGQISVSIYRTGEVLPVESYTLDTTANDVHNNVFTEALELPLWIDGIGEFDYYVVYSLPAGFKPLNTTLCCNCNGCKEQYDHWGNIRGFKTPVFTQVSDLYNVNESKYSFGLSLVADISCKKSDILCSQNFDYENDEVAMNMAYAVQELSGMMLMTDILTKTDSAYVAMNEEQMNFLINNLHAQYNSRLEYISCNYAPNHDCFICDPELEITSI